MNRSVVTVHTVMSRRILENFVRFDTFRLKRAWRNPCLFSLIMCAFAVVCFALTEKAQSAFIGSILLMIGLGLPAVYFASFFSQLKGAVTRYGLHKKDRPAYTLTLGDDVRIRNDMKAEDEVVLTWESILGVWRGKDAAYLYATAQKAFVMPDGQADVGPGELWDFLETRLPKEKLHGIRK